MKVIRFRGEKLNSHLTLDVKFNDGLSFLTGINGSGKTTVLNSIISLLMPRLDYLAVQSYAYISIDIEHNRKKHVISSKRTKSGASISIDSIKNEPLDIFAVEWDESYTPSKNREIEQTFFREQMSRNALHPVLQFIQGLPTPMFLGIDRRTINQEEPRHRYPATRAYPYSTARRRNIFSQSLSQSLGEALGLAFESFRRSQREKAIFDDKLKQDLVLDLVDFTPSIFPGDLEVPTLDKFNEIVVAKKNLERLPELLGVSEERVAAKLTPLFDFFDATQKKIADMQSKKRKPSDDEMAALFAWSMNQSHLTKISSISERISKYNQGVDRIFRDTDRFISLVSHFLNDSGKVVKFNSFGDLVFSMPGDKAEHDLQDLSSGEAQLIVILAHLHFNPEVKNASVFIIDEPELSLHVEWQEKFVDALLSASKNTQFILATHSPSIILDKVSNCIDITPQSAK